MDLLTAVFLGLLQGATEFLPVSSSGHLVLAGIFLNVRESSLAFDVALHLGTLVAVLIYFRHDFWQMGRAWLRFRDSRPELQRLRRLAVYICLATVPAVVAALLFNDYVETYFRQTWTVAVALAGVGLLLLLGERWSKHQRDLQTLTITDGLLIGLAQALALIPGVSRSGITMTAGLFRGLDRPTVARFSFLLSAPIILGAGVHELPAILEQGAAAGGDGLLFFASGFTAAAVSGYLFIAFLLRFIRTYSFAAFAYYRLALAALVLGLQVFR